MSLWQKRVFYTRTGRTACVWCTLMSWRELGSVWRDVPRVPVCLSACLCGLNPRTVPQLSLNKFSGLVLGLNVSISFVLCVLQMEHVQNKLDQAEVADIITSQKIAGSAGPTPGFVPACFYFLGVAVDALSLNTVAATPQHIVLLYLLREKRREETHSGYTRLSQKLISCNLPKVSD